MRSCVYACSVLTRVLLSISVSNRSEYIMYVSVFVSEKVKYTLIIYSERMLKGCCECVYIMYVSVFVSEKVLCACVMCVCVCVCVCVCMCVCVKETYNSKEPTIRSHPICCGDLHV